VSSSGENLRKEHSAKWHPLFIPIHCKAHLQHLCCSKSNDSHLLVTITAIRLANPTSDLLYLYADLHFIYTGLILGQLLPCVLHLPCFWIPMRHQCKSWQHSGIHSFSILS